ncbi:MAG TPA: FlgD immunoglobulin-like domain containing protein [Candidatus Krumholzibacteria bacterium]|nr:FlgD immunoglobulin-like domain containing protein [Candidatus Krumholzibacteria bacterium]
MPRCASLVLAILCIFQAPTRASDAVDYATYPTLYESRLPGEATNGIARCGDFVLTLHGGQITVWDFGDSSHPVRRGELSEGYHASFLFAHGGECYAYVRTDETYCSRDGRLDRIDLGDPDNPQALSACYPGYIKHVVSWGDALVYNLYHSHWEDYDTCNAVFSGTKVLRFSTPTRVSIEDIDLGTTDFLGSQFYLWNIHYGRLIAHEPGLPLDDALSHAVPLNSQLLGAQDSRVWLRSSPTTIDCYRASPDTLMRIDRISSSFIGAVSRVLPWDGGVLALGSFGVQTFDQGGGAAPIWRGTRSPYAALVDGNRAWVASQYSGIEQILLDPPLETPPKLGEIAESYSRMNISDDGHFLFAEKNGHLDAWDLWDPAGPQLSGMTATGRSDPSTSIGIQGDRIALTYLGVVQLYRFDAADGLPHFVQSFAPIIRVSACSFAGDHIVLFGENDGFEIHQLGEVYPRIGYFDASNDAPLKSYFLDGDMAWLQSNNYDLIGVSIADPQAPEATARIPLVGPITFSCASDGYLLTLGSEGECHAYQYEIDFGVSDRGRVVPEQSFEAVTLRDGNLYTVKPAEMGIYQWNDGNPTLLGLQEGSDSHRARGIVVRGSSMAVLKYQDYVNDTLHLYPAQRAAISVPVLLESFEAIPSDTRRQIVWTLATPVPVASLRLVVLALGLESELSPEYLGANRYRAWDDSRTQAVSYRLLERQPDGSWIVLHEERVAGTTLSWVGPKILQNPVHSSLRVAYAQPRTGVVRLDVIDLAGRRIASVQSGVLSRGLHSLQWNGLDVNGRKVSRGTYILRARSEGHVSSTKFTWMR